MTQTQPRPRGTTIHVSLVVRDALGWPKKALRGMLAEGDRTLGPDEAREALLEHLSLGHELLPSGGCAGFDWKAGCPGHQEPAHEAAE